MFGKKVSASVDFWLGCRFMCLTPAVKHHSGRSESWPAVGLDALGLVSPVLGALLGSIRDVSFTALEGAGNANVWLSSLRPFSRFK